MRSHPESFSITVSPERQPERALPLAWSPWAEAAGVPPAPAACRVRFSAVGLEGRGRPCQHASPLCVLLSPPWRAGSCRHCSRCLQAFRDGDCLSVQRGRVSGPRQRGPGTPSHTHVRAAPEQTGADACARPSLWKDLK